MISQKPFQIKLCALSCFCFGILYIKVSWLRVLQFWFLETVDLRDLTEVSKKQCVGIIQGTEILGITGVNGYLFEDHRSMLPWQLAEK